MKRTLFLSILIVFFTTSFMSFVGYSENKTKNQSSVSEKSSSDWIEYGTNKNGDVYLYNKGNIEKNKEKYTVQVWTKIVYSNKGREKYIQNMIKDGLSTKGWDKLSYTMSLFEIDCKKKWNKPLFIIEYDTDNSVLWSDNYDDSKWEYIVPDTKDDTLQKKVCE